MNKNRKTLKELETDLSIHAARFQLANYYANREVKGAQDRAKHYGVRCVNVRKQIVRYYPEVATQRGYPEAN